MSQDTQSHGWTAGALLFAGRPDPVWKVSEELARTLLDQFGTLIPARRNPPAQTRLGYRGVWLSSPEGRRWMAFHSTTWCMNTGDVRTDPDACFEQAILSSVPPDVRALIKSTPS